MKKRLVSLVLISALFLNFAAPVFADDTTPVPYDDKEFPQTLKDLRRFEIITLGALPFVTLDTTLVYSTIRYAKHDFSADYQPDIFNKTSYTQDEQKTIIATSLGICVGIGLTDLIVQIIKRSGKKRRARQITYDDIAVYPISEDPDASQIPLPSESETVESEVQEIETDVQEIEE